MLTNLLAKCWRKFWQKNLKTSIHVRTIKEFMMRPQAFDAQTINKTKFLVLNLQKLYFVETFTK